MSVLAGSRRSRRLPARVESVRDCAQGRRKADLADQLGFLRVIHVGSPAGPGVRAGQDAGLQPDLRVVDAPLQPSDPSGRASATGPSSSPQPVKAFGGDWFKMTNAIIQTVPPKAVSRPSRSSTAPVEPRMGAIG